MWRMIAMVLLCGALALPVAAQDDSWITNANAQDVTNANAGSSGGVSSARAQGGNPDVTATSFDHESAVWTVGMIALAVIVVGAIVWAASGRDYDTRPMHRA